MGDDRSDASPLTVDAGKLVGLRGFGDMISERVRHTSMNVTSMQNGWLGDTMRRLGLRFADHLDRISWSTSHATTYLDGSSEIVSVFYVDNKPVSRLLLATHNILRDDYVATVTDL